MSIEPSIRSASPVARRRLAAGALLLGILLPAAARGATTWDGSASTNWFVPANWSAGVPDAADDVTIPAGLVNYPVLSGNGAICRDLTIAAGATLNLAGFSIAIADDFSPGTPNVLLSTANGQLNFTGNNLLLPQIQRPITFAGDIRIARTGILPWFWFQAAVSCDDLIVASGRVLLTTNGGSYTHAFDDVTVAAGATLDRVNATLDIADDVITAGTWDDSDTTGGTFVGGDWTDTGTFTTGTRTVTFDGGAISLITVPDSNDFFNLVIRANTTARTATPIDINGTLTIDSGSLFDANFDLDVTGGAVTCVGTGYLEISSTLTSLGTFTAGSGTVEYNSTTIAQTVWPATYYDLEIDKGATTGTVAGNLTVTHAMRIIGGVLDVNGVFNATGATVSGGPGRLQLGGAVISLGTFTAGTSTVEYDNTAGNQTVAAVTYFDLEIDNGIRIALTGGNVTVLDDLTIVTGELEVDDGDFLRIDDDAAIAGLLDLEPGAELRLSAATALTVSGDFEAVGGASDLAHITSSDTATPGRYSFAITAGGQIRTHHALFEYMNAAGIRIIDNPAVQAIVQIDDTYFGNGASGGTLLSVTNNNNAVTLVGVNFENNTGSLARNVATAGSTAVITINPYGGDFGGPAFENDNGAGTVTPGFIVWGAFSPARLVSFEAIAAGRGVHLAWETAAEWRSLGFALERSVGGGAFAAVGGSLLPATGSPPGGDVYRYLDDTPGAGAGAVYRLVEIDLRGGRTELARATARSAASAAGLLAAPGSSAVPSLAAHALPSASVRRAGAPPEIASAPVAPVASASAMIQTPAPAPVSAVRIRVEPEGVVRVDHDALAAAGFPVGADPARFQLVRDGEPWPIAVLDGGDGSFDPGDAIDFVPAPFSHAETRFDAYVLDLAPASAAPLRIAEIPGAPPVPSDPIDASMATDIIESQDLYVLALADGEGRDHFFDEFLAAPGTLTIPIQLDAAIPGGEPTLIEVALEGWSDDPLSALDHSTRVLWDGIELGVLSSDGSGPYGGAFEVPAALAGSGPHTLALEQELLLLPDVVFLDRVSVTYHREHRARADRLSLEVADPVVRIEGFSGDEIEVYRIDGAGIAERIIGGAPFLASPADWTLTFLAPGPGRIEAFTPAAARAPVGISPLAPPITLDPPQGADWIAIAPESFHAELAPLAALRRAQGLRAEVVSLEEIQDRFGGGRPISSALEEFLRDASEHWRAPEPAFVLLVGDATYDPAGHLGASPRQLLPAPLIEVGGIQTVSDARLVDGDGDGAADVAIGRFPVATAAECQALVAKTIAYETARGSLPARQVLFVADDESDFDGTNGALEALLPPAIGAVHLDLATMPITTLRAALLGAEWADATVVHYSGHGARQRLADEGILLLADVPGLPADPLPPVVVAMNCWNGFFQHPLTPSLGEALLLAADRGAIAYFGPSAVTTTVGQQALAEELAVRLFAAPQVRLGAAIVEAKEALAGDPACADVLATWVLLGDPALIVR